MANTYIDSNAIPRTKAPGAGEFAEILNERLAGAKNVVATLRWLNAGDAFDARSNDRTHQLIYLLDGEGTITLNAREHPVRKGAGVYLGPTEFARISHAGRAPLRLFQLVVPKQD